MHCNRIYGKGFKDAEAGSERQFSPSSNYRQFHLRDSFRWEVELPPSSFTEHWNIDCELERSDFSGRTEWCNFSRTKPTYALNSSFPVVWMWPYDFLRLQHWLAREMKCSPILWSRTNRKFDSGPLWNMAVKRFDPSPIETNRPLIETSDNFETAPDRICRQNLFKWSRVTMSHITRGQER